MYKNVFVCYSTKRLIRAVSPHVNAETALIHVLLRRFGVGELKWSAQSPYLISTEQLWDELKCQLHTRPPHQTSVSGITNVHTAE